MTRPIKVRYVIENEIAELDEVLAVSDEVSLHLEKLDRNRFSLIVEARRERDLFELGAKQAAVECIEVWRERVTRKRKRR